MSISLNSIVRVEGREYEVIAEYWPYKSWDSISKVKHYMLKPFGWTASRYGLTGRPPHQVQFFTQVDKIHFESVGSSLIPKENILSITKYSKKIQMVTKEYDPKQQPWEDGDI